MDFYLPHNGRSPYWKELQILGKFCVSLPQAERRNAGSSLSSYWWPGAYKSLHTEWAS